MGGSGSKRISLNSIDNLSPDIFQTYLEKSKHAINDQYDSNTSIIYFPEIIQDEMEEEIRKNRDEETVQAAPIKEVKKRLIEERST